MATFFNFKQEVLYKYDIDIFHEFMEAFDTLPLACILNDSFLCIHAGISSAIRTVFFTKLTFFLR